MNDTEREVLKEQLRAMASGRGDGIELDSPDRWVVECLEDPGTFFRNLSLLIPAESVLYFEGINLAPEVVKFYEDNPAPNAVCVARDTIFPIPQSFHVLMKPGVIEGLLDLLQRYPHPACFIHL